MLGRRIRRLEASAAVVFGKGLGVGLPLQKVDAVDAALTELYMGCAPLRTRRDVSPESRAALHQAATSEVAVLEDV